MKCVVFVSQLIEFKQQHTSEVAGKSISSVKGNAIHSLSFNIPVPGHLPNLVR